MIYESELYHRNFKYIDKYKSKAGKWVYVYKNRLKDYKRALSSKDEKNAIEIAENQRAQKLNYAEKTLNEISRKDFRKIAEVGWEESQKTQEHSLYKNTNAAYNSLSKSESEKVNAAIRKYNESTTLKGKVNALIETYKKHKASDLSKKKNK